PLVVDGESVDETIRVTLTRQKADACLAWFGSGRRGRTEELGDRDGSCDGSEEAVCQLRVRSQPREERLLLLRRRRQGRELVRELVHRSRLLVADALVVCERVVQRPCTRERLVERVGQQLRVTKGVRDSLCRDRVLVVAGVAHECPPRAVRLPVV